MYWFGACISLDRHWHSFLALFRVLSGRCRAFDGRMARIDVLDVVGGSVRACVYRESFNLEGVGIQVVSKPVHPS